MPPFSGIVPEIDPGEAPLVLSRDNGYAIFSPIKSPSAQASQQLTSSAATEGELAAGSRDQNTELGLHMRITDPGEEGDEAAFRESQIRFEQKIDKLVREGGVLRLNYPDGSWIDWEVRGVTGGERLLDNRFVHYKRTEDEITFLCAPFGKGEEELVGEYKFAGEAKRILDCVIDDVPGSAPALARAEISSPESDVWDLKWGKESMRYSPAATAKPLYAASEMTPLGGAAASVVTVDGKANTAVVRGTLTKNWTAALATDIPGLGPLTHDGVYEVLLWVHMPASNLGEVGVGLEYGVGDLLDRVELEPTYFPAGHSREGKVVQLSAGQAFIRASGRGDHRWTARVLAKSTVVADILDILDVGFRPLLEGRGEISIEPAFRQPAALLVSDDFSQAAGPLNGKPIAAARQIAGSNYAGVGANNASVGSLPWSNPGGITAVGGAAATCAESPAAGTLSEYITATNFGFNLPPSAVIEGILFEYWNQRLGPGGGFIYSRNVEDAQVRAIKGGVIQGVNRSAGRRWSPSPALMVYGGENDLLGVPWLYSDINSNGFGLALAVLCDAGCWGAVDWARARIFWSDSTNGQKWVTSGDAADFTVDEANGIAKRTEVSDASLVAGRYAVAGTQITSDIMVGLKMAVSPLSVVSGEAVRYGAMAREVDENNWLLIGFEGGIVGTEEVHTVRVVKRVAGTTSVLAEVRVLPEGAGWRHIWLQVDRRGRYFAWGSLLDTSAPRLFLAGQDNDLAAAGPLDDGKIGFYDAKTGAVACNRWFDQFAAWIPQLDAVIYQGLTLELTDSACRRQTAGGEAWADITPDGEYLKLAPSGMENRKNRLVFVASAHDPELMGVGFPSKLIALIYVTPRYRTVPNPAA